jgi:5'(3')-deoxyribonucleotidase
MKRKIVYVDLDDVMCNFTKSYNEKKSEEYFYPQSIYGFFRNLEPIEDAINSYKILEHYYDVYILTAPSVYNPLCYTEKRDWVEKHLGFETCRKLIISPNKGLLKGDYLIDDNIHIGFKGEHIHFGNEKFPNWKAVLKHLIKIPNKISIVTGLLECDECSNTELNKWSSICKKCGNYIVF